MRKIISFIFFFVIGVFNVKAQQTGFDIFNFAPSPSILALSEAATALPNGAGSTYINPALLALMDKSSIDVGYSNMIGDASNIFGGVNFKSKNRAVALSIYRSGDDSFEQRDTQGPSNGNFSVSYLSVTGALAYDLDFISVGASAHYLFQEVFLDKTTGYSFNIGVAKEFWSGRFKTGASVVNIGKMNPLVAQEPKLPTAFRLGGAFDLLRFTPPKNKDLPILVSISGDYVVPLQEKDANNNIGFFDDRAFANFGLNLNIAETVELKTGLKTGNTARPYSFGIGFITELLTFNYALIPYDTGFGTVHSIGLQYKF